MDNQILDDFRESNSNEELRKKIMKYYLIFLGVSFLISLSIIPNSWFQNYVNFYILSAWIIFQIIGLSIMITSILNKFNPPYSIIRICFTTAILLSSIIALIMIIFFTSTYLFSEKSFTVNFQGLITQFILSFHISMMRIFYLRKKSIIIPIILLIISFKLYDFFFL